MADTNKTPNCDMREALISYLYNEATPGDGLRVESHIEQCAACKQELEGFQQVRGMMQQWQVSELPTVHFATPGRGEAQAPRSAIAVLKELFTVMPVWAKAVGVAATVIVIFAVIGTEIRISSNEFSIRADLMRGSNFDNAKPPASASDRDPVRLEEVRAEVKTLVNAMLAESERQQSEAIKAQLINLESQLQTVRAADLAKLSARIQEQRALLKTLERDIDRREGLGLTDILFSEVTTNTPRADLSDESGED